jgi:hypothetical protein
MIKPKKILKIIQSSFFKGSIEVRLIQGDLKMRMGGMGRLGIGVKGFSPVHPISLSPYRSFGEKA